MDNGNTSSAKGRFSLEDGHECDPQANVLMRRNGLRGLLVAASVLVFSIIVILLSKWNEVRLQRVPVVWKNRLKGLVHNSTVALKLARSAPNNKEQQRYAEDARLILSSAKMLAGTVDLSKLSSYDVATLDTEIDSILQNTTPLPPYAKAPDMTKD